MWRLAPLLCVLGCSGAPDAEPPPDLGPERIVVGATDGTVELASDFSIDGAGQVSLAGRALPAATYLRQTFPNLHLFQTLAVEPDRLWVLWFYCSTKDSTLQGIYYESTDGTAVTFEDATGTCQEGPAAATVPVRFPAIDLALPALVPGFTIEGPEVHLDGAAPGRVTLAGAPLTVLVFNTVDCTSGCGTPGWTELHAILWDRAAGRACFGIFYLTLDDPTHVQLAWSLTLPSLIDPAGNARLNATWSAP